MLDVVKREGRRPRHQLPSPQSQRSLHAGGAFRDRRYPTRLIGAGQVMNGMSCAGMMTMGRIMSRSSCSRMWQWYM